MHICVVLRSYLGDKFNLPAGETSFSTHAVYVCCDDGSQRMLEESENPIALSLAWSDPSEGTFMLMQLPKGVTRVSLNNCFHIIVTGNIGVGLSSAHVGILCTHFATSVADTSMYRVMKRLLQVNAHAGRRVCG